MFRIGVATNFKTDSQVAASFATAVETVTGLGNVMTKVDVAFAGPNTGTRHIERDRQAVARLPAISVPCGFDSNGLPIGLQIVAAPSADLDVLALGHQYERAAGCADLFCARDHRLIVNNLRLYFVQRCCACCCRRPERS